MKFVKILSLTMLTSIVMVSCKQSSNQQDETTNPPVENTNVAEDTVGNEVAGVMEKASFEIEGMSCAVGCAAKIEKDLAKLPGVKSAKVDFETKKATVEYDNAKQNPISLQSTVEGIAKGAYKVSQMSTNKDMAMIFDQDDKTTKKKSCCSKGSKGCTDKKADKKDATTTNMYVA